MGDAPGIAGSDRPEVHGVYVCTDESTVNWFVRLNNTGGPVDVWSFECADEDDLVDDGTGFGYLLRRVPPDALRLVQGDLPSGITSRTVRAPSDAYQSMLTITLDDGTVLKDDAAHAHIRNLGSD